MELLTFLNNALTETSKEIAMTKYPDIVFPEHVYVDSSADRLMDTRQHLIGDSTGDTDDGLIDINTTVFDQVDMRFDAKSTTLTAWMKTVGWTKFQLEKAMKLGIKLDTSKINALNHNAQQTLQKVAFLGHPRKAGISGLLTASELTVQNFKSGKVIQAMTYDEAVDAIKEMFFKVLEQTHSIATPDSFSISADDYAHLALLEKDLRDKTALQWLTEKLSGAAGKPVTIRPIPGNFAKRVTKGKTRALAYINNKDHVLFDVPQSPTIIPAQQVGLVSYQSGLQMAFGGVTFKEPQSAVYVDY